VVIIGYVFLFLGMRFSVAFSNFLFFYFCCYVS
jgi:hypothetical protein